MAVASAVLLLLSFPPFGFHFLIWIALTPLLHVIAQGVNRRRAFFLGWMVGIEFTFFAQNWIAHSMTVFGGMWTVAAYMVALFFAAILALFPGLFALAMTQLLKDVGPRGLAAAPLVWVATEWLRPMVTSVTWNGLGITQVQNYEVAKLAQFGGVYLISAEIVALNALIIMALRFAKTKERSMGVAMALLTLAALSALFLRQPLQNIPSTQREVRVIGVQPNLPPDKATTAIDLETNVRMTRDALAASPEKKADLIIWAESPLSLFYEGDEYVKRTLDALAAETHSFLIVNAIATNGTQYYNSVQTIGPETGGAGYKRYDKVHLVPFGEYVPFNSLLKYVVPRVISSDSGGFAAGTAAVVNVLKLETERGIVISGDPSGKSMAGESLERTTQFLRVGSFICYEAAYPDLIRQFAKNGAGLLINVSNDAWFGSTAGAQQHLAHAAMRAIENNRDLLRVTNTGISSLITAEGKVIDRLPSFTPATGYWRAQPRTGTTFYTRHGDRFAVVAALAAGLILLLGALISRRTSGMRNR
jgi:apolipoprotein N-acyltransferase